MFWLQAGLFDDDSHCEAMYDCHVTHKLTRVRSVAQYFKPSGTAAILKHDETFIETKAAAAHQK